MKAGVTEASRSTSRILILLTSPWFIVAVAFALRLENILGHHLYLIPTDNDHALFGFEMGRLARSIAMSRGFSQVFDPASGPTAWWTPVFPLLLGGIFKIFGIYSAASAFVILSLNSSFSALTCYTIFFVACETLGRTTATVSAWVWALLPYAIYWPTHHIWETSLSAFLLTLAIFCALRMAESHSLIHWTGFGLLWGFIALTNAAMLSFLPIALLWIWRTHPRSLVAYFRELGIFAFALTLVVFPWILRNEKVMGKFIFPRSDFGFELYVGNHGEGYSRESFRGPFWNLAEREKYDQLGEIIYMSEKQRLGIAFMEQHPGAFVVSTLERVLFFWITAPDEYWLLRGRNLFRQGVFLTLSLTGFAGLYLANKNRVRGILLFGGVLFFYPLVYYVTHVEARYSHPLAPVMIILIVYAISELYIALTNSPILPEN
ncbi:MAG TPA: glycosyltransferase family 39 protein [Terriglobales bacterium]|nr:glycosyltransferase family 39 protein [Terriglobales bacterium]